MILVDTSVWVDHFRATLPKLTTLLETCQVLAHPFVIGELTLGTLRQRKIIVQAMQDLSPAIIASDDEVLALIERHSLSGLGIGYVDAHLLASARLSDAWLWTHDKRLHEAANKLRLALR